MEIMFLHFLIPKFLLGDIRFLIQIALFKFLEKEECDVPCGIEQTFSASIVAEKIQIFILKIIQNAI
jgi:hypothetical protein